jgi:hypothetical protein
MLDDIHVLRNYDRILPNELGGIFFESYGIQFPESS